MIQKIISFLVIITLTLPIFSQVRKYDETALLFSQDKLNGTARFVAMSGAFGAVGGDLSAGEINPAGMAIFNSNHAAITLDVNTIKTNNSFYNLSSKVKSSDLNFAQAGGLIIFKTGKDQWSKFTLSINTTTTNDFYNYITLKGNNHISNEGYFLNPDPTADLYDNVDLQEMRNKTFGTNSKTTFAIATKFNKNTYFGFSIMSNSINYNQEINAFEGSQDINNNTFEAELNQQLNVYGAGVSFGFGAITSPMENLRLGLSYQTPTWYTLTEEFNKDMTISLSNANVTQPKNVDSYYEYNLRTPGKTTASITYIFEKQGLISLDYSYKDYSMAKLSPTSEFENETNYNQRIKDDYTAVSSINIGGEYRLKYISLRGGYHFESNPYKNYRETKNINGYSLGFGFKTSQYSKLDFAFNQTDYINKSYYLSSPEPINSSTKINKFTVSYSMNF